MTAIASDIITALNNRLELCELKNAELKSNKLPVDIEKFVEDLQGVCYENDTLIKRCKYFVYNREKELNFAYYEALKKKVSLLLEQQYCFKTKLEKLGHDTNYKFADFYNDITFDLIDFSNPDKFSSNQKQSDEFNNFVDFASISTDLQTLPKVQSKTIEIANHTAPSEIEETHPPHHPNLWNKPCYELFKYLFDNYYNNKTKRKLTNIWFFLKEKQSKTYIFLATKDMYVDFLKVNYNISITNFDKAINKYDDKDLPSLNGHCINFENN
ncbi:hypothetical protein [Chryseobacterium sp.]|uniref:hypothetical protein n=1 Tax=Chryseobacterium sp. TaxID=1871047 RepID=UPI002FC5D9EF